MKRAPYSSANGATWSCHRDQQLQACERKYYFQYLSDARLNSDDPKVRQIALLKKLKNIPMWQGDAVHLEIARCVGQLRKNVELDHKALVLSLNERMKREWSFSERRLYRSDPYAVGKTGAALYEHEYKELNGAVALEVAVNRAGEMLRNFLAWAKEDRDFIQKVKTADNIWIEPPAWGADAPGFLVGDVQVITKVDLALQHRNREFTVYDWKTGKAPRASAALGKNEIQINVYMMWANLGLKLPLEQISSRLVYLGGEKAEELRFDLDEERAEQTYRLVEDSVQLSQQWEASFRNHRLSLKDLDYAGSVEECRRCNFKALCRENLVK